MTITETEVLTSLYLSDETAWLEAMADLIGQREFSELDYDNLREYLIDMAIRDRREILSRLIVLIQHHLKWQFQPKRKKAGWRLTITEQRQELTTLFKSGTLKKHAEEVLAEAYRSAVERAVIETGLPKTSFPAVSKLSAREWVALPVPESN